METSHTRAGTRPPKTWPLEAGDCCLHFLRSSAALLQVPIKALQAHVGLNSSHELAHPLTAAAGDAVIAVASHLAGVPKETLVSGHIHTLLGTTLLPFAPARPAWTRDRVYLDAQPACLFCLADRPWAVRSAWRIPILPDCLLHEAPLIMRCPRCAHPIRGSRRTCAAEPTADRCLGCGETFLALARNATTTPPPRMAAVRVIAQEVARQGAGEQPTFDLAAVQDLTFLFMPEGRARGANPKDIFQIGCTSDDHALERALEAVVSPSTAHSARLLAHVSDERLESIMLGRRGALRPAAIRMVATERRRRGWPRSVHALKGVTPESWPQLTPPDVFALTTSDILFDLLDDDPGGPAYLMARAISSVLATAQAHQLTPETAAGALGLGRRCIDLTEHVRIRARSTGREEGLQEAVQACVDVTLSCWHGRLGRSRRQLAEMRAHTRTTQTDEYETEVGCRAPEWLAA